MTGETGAKPHEAEPEAPLPPTDGDAQALIGLWQASAASEKAYGHAVVAVDSEPFRFSLNDMLERHRRLSSWLSERIEASAFEVPESVSIWGNILMFLERIGAAIGQRACLSVLQSGEIQSLKQARALLEEVEDPALARWVEEEWIVAVEENRGELDSMLYALWTA